MRCCIRKDVEDNGVLEPVVNPWFLLGIRINLLVCLTAAVDYNAVVERSGLIQFGTNITDSVIP
jgi:hypothetical protein